MKSINKLIMTIFYGILVSIFIALPTNTVAQTNFIRNDNFDIQAIHELWATSDPNNFWISIIDSTDFPFFKLEIKKKNLNLFDTDPWYATRYKITFDGSVVQDWTTDAEKIISYNFPNPPNGISANHSVSIQVDYADLYGSPLPTKSASTTITIFTKPRVYVDSDNNSFVQLRNEDPTAKVPVLMVEGFDPLNESFPELYYSLTWPLVNTDLYPNGYEVFILNFNDGGRDLRLNADVVLKAIEKIHEICPNYQIVVAGLSMGGPIVRYALAKKESQGGTHNVGLFVSYDSPQQAAHVSPGLQDWIAGQDPGNGAIKDLQDNLKSIAAQQMLGYDTYDPFHAYHDGFYNELKALNGNGYPHQSYNVAVSNGNFSATWGYSSVGRDLMTLKINGVGIKTVSAVQLDCGTGSKMPGLEGKRYGDIFSIPFLRVYYELDFVFNPVYHPTWSSLDLVGTQINQTTGDISSFDHSKFDDFVIQTNPLYHSDLSTVTRNKITTWLNKTSSITVNYNLPESGSITPDNYQVKILRGIPITVQPRTVQVNGKQITFTFWKWSDGSTENPRTIYTSHDVSYTAIMKGIQLSNNVNGYANNSQRKVIRTADNYIHMVYESLNRVWYERSTDNGSTWQIMNNGQPLSTSDSKLPAIDSYNNNVGIVFQEKNGDSYKIKFVYFDINGMPYTTTIVQDAPGGAIPTPYSFDANPVFTWTNGGAAMFAWQETVVIYYRYGALNYFYWGIEWYTQPTYLSGTDQNSIRPTISVEKNSSYPVTFHLAWGQTTSNIYYCTFTQSSGNTVQISSAQNVSSGSSYPYNYNPQIAVTGSQVYLTWIGEVTAGWNTVVNRVKNGSTWSSAFNFYGANAASPTLQFVNGTNQYIIAWSESDGNANKFYRCCYSGGIINFDTWGKSLQVINGNSLDYLYALSFNSFSPPYFFKRTRNSVLAKTASTVTANGRRGIINKDGAEYYFTIGDVKADGNLINFAPANDYEEITNTKDLQSFLTSESFSLNDASDFKFSLGFGVRDSLKAIEKLDNNDKITFTVSIVDAETEKPVGEYQKIVFDEGSDFSRQNNSFQINTKGIGNRNVKLRIGVKDNFNAKYTLAKILATDNVLEKNTYKEISYEGNLAVTTYDLAQNYPNPFNPSTVINYQLPKEGFVTLKVYDILGREVKTLVNEYQNKGRYNVTFNAGELASGIYIYQLRSNDFVANKKLMLMK